MICFLFIFTNLKLLLVYNTVTFFFVKKKKKFDQINSIQTDIKLYYLNWLTFSHKTDPDKTTNASIPFTIPHFIFLNNHESDTRQTPEEPFSCHSFRTLQ